MAKRRKGDVRRENFVQQDGPNAHEYLGEYESIGSEPQPTSKHQRPADDPERIDPKDWEDMNQSNEQWQKGGRKGSVPAFKAPADFDNSFPDSPGGRPYERYEHWRLRPERPMMARGGPVMNPKNYLKR